MSRLVVDSNQLQTLEGGKKSAEVCDDTGRVLGLFLPHDEYLCLRAAADFDKPLDPAEREQAIQDMLAGRLRTSDDLRAEFDRIRQTPPRG